MNTHDIVSTLHEIVAALEDGDNAKALSGCEMLLDDLETVDIDNDFEDAAYDEEFSRDFDSFIDDEDMDMDNEDVDVIDAYTGK